MDQKQAVRLGTFLRKTRQDLGLSTHEVAEAAGINQTTVVRVEQGAYLTPDPDKITRLADALSLDPADLLERAGYAVPTDLLTPATYLRAKYPDLTDESLRSLTADVARALKRHGIDATAEAAPGPTTPMPYRSTNSGPSRSASAKS